MPTADDRKTVELMVAVGIPHEGIAICIGENGIDDKTLRKHFRRELDTAKIKVDAKIGGTIVREAIAGHSWACSLYAVRRMGWKEPPQEHKVEGDLTIRIIDPTNRG